MFDSQSDTSISLKNISRKRMVIRTLVEVLYFMWCVCLYVINGALLFLVTVFFVLNYTILNAPKIKKQLFTRKA